MNTAAVKQEIDNIVSEIKNNRQYPTSKAQDAQLKELGIYDLMPMTQVKGGRRFIGYTDAAAVIAAATSAKTAVMNAHGEGEEIGASKLYALLNEQDAPAVMNMTTDSIVGEQIVADFDAMLEDVAAYEGTRENPDEADYMADHLEAMSENKAEFQQKLSVYKAQLARGKAFYADGYRARTTERHIEGHAGGDSQDVPVDALAQRKVWSGHIATSPSFRWQYLVKIGG